MYLNTVKNSGNSTVKSDDKMGKKSVNRHFTEENALMAEKPTKDVQLRWPSGKRKFKSQ